MTTAPNAIQIEHRYSHPPASVWRALTDPALHARWWAAGDVKAVVGHRFTLDMGAWGKQPCEVLAVEPERLLSYRFGIGTLDTTITWRVTPDGAGTLLTMTHEGFNLEAPMGRSALDGMRSGWPNVLARMEVALAG
jgi:uncharacterized protein YndB with AHSA1/START domain